MNVSPSDPVEQRLSRHLKSRRMRHTPERFAILRRCRMLRGHFDVESLHRAMEEDSYHVSRATVYNTVQLLCEAGILRKLMLESRETKYEMAEENHLHLVCTSCGKIRELKNDELITRLASVRFDSFTTSYISACVYGLCLRCRRKVRKEGGAEPKPRRQEKKL